MLKVTVEVRLKKSILDTQGAAVERALKSYGDEDIQSVRVGKIIEILVEGDDAKAAEARANEWADKLLANPIMETYSVAVEPIQ